MIGTAVMSPCGRYRYALEREVGNGPNLVWLMLNPSTADASVDDPTIRKVKSFTRRNGYGVAMVVNLFALRSTSPKGVAVNPADAVGEQNSHAIMQAASLTDVVVCAWGNEAGRPWVRHYAATVMGWLERAAFSERPPRLVCLGTNKDGSPRHPLMVPYAQALVPFDDRRYR